MKTLTTINLSDRVLEERPGVRRLAEILEDFAANQSLDNTVLYYDFPIFRDEHDELLRSQIALIGPRIGLLLAAVDEDTGTDDCASLRDTDDRLNRVFSHLYSRLLRTQSLQRDKRTLAVPVISLIFAPNLREPRPSEIENPVFTAAGPLKSFLEEQATASLSEEQLRDLSATFQGARGLTRPKARATAAAREKSLLVAILDQLETEMSGFDLKQTEGYVTELDGPQRIRGLAGSGKTVVLSMKAALTHLRHPKAKILYTFHTKSLYQHVKKTITRFYREFDDRDPDWDRIIIQHSWGGPRSPGVYYDAAISAGITPLTLQAALSKNAKDPLDAACTDLFEKATPEPEYDYVFIDEGQDFPASFIRLCEQRVREHRFILAFDELQTIFRPSIPSAAEIFGTDKSGKPLLSFTKDVVLYKCYRNPREVLVAAHAVGFGIYGQIVQMLEDEEHWNTIGYEVEQGQFREGDDTVILRPERNSLPVVSQRLPKDEIVKMIVCDTFEEEIARVAQAVKGHLDQGLRADDLLIIVVDDQHAKPYLRSISRRLMALGVEANDIHTNVYGVPDFYVPGEVTLSTVHKAKGNEAFVVYVVGCDALFRGTPTVQERNILFTAMTRAKGLLRLYGSGDAAKKLKREIDLALEYFPRLRFRYPGSEAVKRIRKDWKKSVVRKERAKSEIGRLLEDFEPEELIELLKQRKKDGDRIRE